MRFFLLALFVFICSACSTFSNGLTPSEQYNSMVMIRTTCSDGRVLRGSGFLVAEDRAVTALHVVQCPVADGIPIYLPATRIEVIESATDLVDAEVEVEIAKADVARLKLKTNKLAGYFRAVRIGPPPIIGAKVCVVHAVPRSGYR